jgi:hypothetical protein
MPARIGRTRLRLSWALLPPRYFFDSVSDSSLWPNRAALTPVSSDQIHLC